MSEGLQVASFGLCASIHFTIDHGEVVLQTGSGSRIAESPVGFDQINRPFIEAGGFIPAASILMRDGHANQGLGAQFGVGLRFGLAQPYLELLVPLGIPPVIRQWNGLSPSFLGRR